jgi:hypothetical protein
MARRQLLRKLASYAWGYSVGGIPVASPVVLYK